MPTRDDLLALAAHQDWDLIVQVLHHSGTYTDLLHPAMQQAIRAQANGFGEGVTSPDLLWDWSHVRDSPPEAIARMASTIRRAVCRMMLSTAA